MDEVDPFWKVPQRFVARQPSPTGPGWEALVKWTNQGYEHCTWEVSQTPPPPFPPHPYHGACASRMCLQDRCVLARRCRIAKPFPCDARNIHMCCVREDSRQNHAA